jgi:hypothetical protein
MVIAGWPVQFLPPGTPLVEEALDEAVEHDLGGAPVREIHGVSPERLWW